MATFASVAAQLNNLLHKTRYESMQRAVLAAEAESKRQAPVKSGTLRRSLTSRVEAGGKRGVVGTNIQYARAVHDGSKPHVIKPTRAKALFWKGALHPVRSVNHPGYKGDPWFERAAERSRERIERELKAVFDKALVSIR